MHTPTHRHTHTHTTHTRLFFRMLSCTVREPHQTLYSRKQQDINICMGLLFTDLSFLCVEVCRQRVFVCCCFLLNWYWGAATQSRMSTFVRLYTAPVAIPLREGATMPKAKRREKSLHVLEIMHLPHTLIDASHRNFDEYTNMCIRMHTAFYTYTHVHMYVPTKELSIVDRNALCF